MATKTWRMAAEVSRDGKTLVSVYREGRRQRVEDMGDLAAAEILVGSLAVCLGASCQIVMKARSLPAAVIDVDVLATKAADPPSRVATARAAVRISADLDHRRRQRILDNAKRICTVSNSLSSEIELTVVDAATEATA